MGGGILPDPEIRKFKTKGSVRPGQKTDTCDEETIPKRLSETLEESFEYLSLLIRKILKGN